MAFTPLSRTGWGASVSDATFGAASNAIDGNTSTIWATNGSFPAWIVLDMLSAQTFNALTYLPRQDGWLDFPGSIEIYVSSDGVTWGTPVFTASGLPNSASQQGFVFASQTFRYLKFNILSAAAGARVYQGAAEINVGTWTGTVLNRLTTIAEDAIIASSPPKARLTWIGEDAILTGLTTPRNRLTRLSIEKLLVPGVFVTTNNRLTTFALESVIQLPAPLARGHIQYDQIRDTARKGAGSMFQMFGGGATQPGDLAMYASDGSIIDAGFPLGTLPIRVVTASYTMTNADYTVVATVPSVTITLPPTPGVGQTANVKNGNATTGQLITVSGGTAAIDVSSTISLGATASLHVQWDGSMWRIL